MAGRESPATLVPVYDTNTGIKHQVPQEWLSDPRMPHLSKTPKAKASGNDMKKD